MPAGISKTGILPGNLFFEKRAFLPQSFAKVYAWPGKT
jgi:hypothetical protein